MATKPAVTSTSQPNWMTTYAPKANLITDEKGELIQPADRLEQQRADFEKAEQAGGPDVSADVQAQLDDVRNEAQRTKKSVAEVIESRHDDVEATKKLEKELRDKAEKQVKESKEEEKKVAEREATTAKAQAEKVAESAQPTVKSAGQKQPTTGNEKAAAKKQEEAKKE